MQRAAPLGMKAHAGELLERHRVIERSLRGQRRVGERRVARAHEDARAMQVGMFALRRAHAERAEALQQLRAVEAFLRARSTDP